MISDLWFAIKWPQDHPLYALSIVALIADNSRRFENNFEIAKTLRVIQAVSIKLINVDLELSNHFRA